MYAIISLQGKQYRVEEGQRLFVDHLAHAGDKPIHPIVLFIGGDGKAEFSPKGAEVTAKVVGDVLGDKIRIAKYKPKTGYKRHAGHRSQLTGDRDHEHRPEGGDEERGKGRGGCACGEGGAGREGQAGRKAEGGSSQEGACEEGPGKERGRVMAHKKGLGSSRNGRDSNPKMLGVKLFSGQR